MAAWTQSAAISSLQTRLGDSAADKHEFRTDCSPTPDGVTTRFFAGQQRIVADSLQVYVGGSLMAVAASGITPAHGTFEMSMAPAETTLQASFNYQWFTEVELIQFLNAATNMLSITGYDSEALPETLRAVVVEFAAYFAYARKATSYADAVEAQGGGYTYAEGKSHPNWRGLADSTLKNAKEMLDLWKTNPLAGSEKALMRFATVHMEDYMPRS